MSKNWKLTSSETLTLSRVKALEYAARHSNLPKSPVEREVDPSRVKKLVKIIRDGWVLPFNWALTTWEDRDVRMNGQHSPLAILEVGGDCPETLTFHVDRYDSFNREGMVELFKQFDQRFSSRSVADIAGAYQGMAPEIAECNRKIIKNAADGVAWWGRTVEGIPMPPKDNTYSLLHEEVYLPFFLWVNGIINARKELMIKEVLAAMWKIYDVSPEGSTAFWREVSFGADYYSDDMAPGAVLIGELSRSLDKSETEFRQKEFSNRGAYYKKSIKAWNAFCAGQRIASLKVSSKDKTWPEPSSYSDADVA